MKIKKNSIKEFVFCYLCAILTTFLFYYANSVNLNRIPIAIIDAFFKSATMVYIIGLIDKSEKTTYISGTVVFLLVILLYNQNSILKYSVDSLYDGSISLDSERLMASILVNVIILVASLLWYKYHKKAKEFSISNKNSVQDLTVNPLPAWGLTIFYSAIQIYYIIATSGLFTLSSTRTLNTFLTIFEYIVFTVVSLNVKKENGKFKPVSVFPIIIISVVLFIGTLFLGGKQIVIRFAIVVVCSLLFQKKINLSHVKYFLYASPLLLQGITSLSEIMSGRFAGAESYAVLRYHVFRYDLADLATTIALKFSKVSNGFQVLKEGFLYAIPSIFFTGKTSLKPEYVENVTSVGLSGSFDYNDTFFSIGAQLGGFIGMVLVFIVVTFLFEILSEKIMRIKKVGPVMLITIFGYFSYAESDWYMFMFNTRDMLLYLVVSYFVFGFMIKSKRGNRQ